MSELQENALASYKINEEFQAAKAEKIATERKLAEEEMARIEEMRLQRDKRPQVLAEYKTFIRNTLLQYVIEAMAADAVHLNDLDDRQRNRFDNYVKSFIVENGGAKSILTKAAIRTPFLEEVAEDIEVKTQDIYDCADKENCKHLTIDGADIKDVIDKVSSKDDFQDIKAAIASKVASAEAEFVNGIEQREAIIKDAMDTAEAKIAKTDINPNMSKETKDAIKQEATQLMQRRIHEAQFNRSKGIFDEMVTRHSKSAMKSDILREAYVLENGRLDMDKVVDAVRLMYGILETVSTTKMMKIDEQFIKNMLDEM